jgi:DNA gyrase/topoisomerase IV subunit A
MINAVELQALEDELKDLRKEVAELKKALAEQRDLVRLLKEEVGFAERGYTKMGVNI